MEEEQSWDAGSVAKLRYELGMSQDQLSKALGVRQQTVSDWETGIHTPKGASAKMLSMVAEARAAYDAGTRSNAKGAR